ncbi:hypothetical protein CEE69_15480 [Rhodopirellula bahusiensis]|uniref:Uncharacterized protein n=1 Tax=Rhodopirellula bahusiensis TaxID=2014065 RepID=A0A2G1W5X6_9BACT|nr:hypothetical protein CEE69_15480 [Rhodopirellula bahusiensis]
MVGLGWDAERRGAMTFVRYDSKDNLFQSVALDCIFTPDCTATESLSYTSAMHFPECDCLGNQFC